MSFQNELRNRLASITNHLLADPIQHTAAREASLAMKDLYLDILGLGIETIAQDPIGTASGSAVSPRGAAFCLHDYLRTRTFIKGTENAIRNLLSEKPGKAVHLLYAGTGPFASLLMPLTLKFSPAELQITGLDINALSLEYLRTLIAAFGTEAYFTTFIHGDATILSTLSGPDPDIILTETMNTALYREPMVDVYSHLSGLYPQALMLPVQVKTELGFFKTSLEKGYLFHLVKPLFELSRETARKINTPGEIPAILQEGVEIDLRDKVAFPDYQLKVLTTITVYGDQQLLPKQSGLTIPWVFSDGVQLADLPETIRVKYQRGNAPEFIVVKEILT